MPDPFVRRVGEVFDIDERSVAVGVDYHTVSVQVGGMEARLPLTQVGELFGLLFNAAWEAAMQSERMRDND
jgi:hypothetical protein